MKVGIVVAPTGVSVTKYITNLVSSLLNNRNIDISLIDIVNKKIINEPDINDEVLKNTLALFPRTSLSFLSSQFKQLIFSKKLQAEVRRSGIDILHIPYLGRPAPPLDISRLEVKIIATNHGMANLALSPHEFYETQDVMRRIYDKVQIQQWKFTLKWISRIITVSYSERNNLINGLCLSPEKIKVIYHGVSPIFRPYSNQKVQNTLQKYGIQGPYIFHVSAYQPKKNILRILQAFSIAKRIYNIPEKLVIGGKQPPKILRYTKNLGITDEIRFIGFIPEKDLPILYSGAKFFVFPSLHESFGLPILEAMASGTPVITSNVFSLRELGDRVALLVNPDNINEIAEAIYILSTDNILRKRLRSKGLKKSRNFTWEATAKKHLRVYKEALMS